MATKPREFDKRYCYHIYNRGIDGRTTFDTLRDYQRFLEVIDFYHHDQDIRFITYQKMSEQKRLYYNKRHPTGAKTRRVKLLAWCLMPNHFHFVLRPARWDGVTKFMSNIANSHTKYFNLKYERNGNLFQSAFKDKAIRSDPSLMQVIRYVHLNPVFSSKTNPGKTLDPAKYPFSSYGEWLRMGETHPTGVLIDWDSVKEWVKYIGGVEKYQEFVESKIEYPPEMGIEDLVIEET